MIGLSAILYGCDASKSTNDFEPNYLFAHALEVETGSPMKQAVAETQAALHVLFGTPDQPKLPAILRDNAEYAKLVRLERVQSAGPSGTGGGLYARHCATCHGTVGNGRGLTAALLEPYPRDYRAGKFKFKSTPRGAKPVREDLFGSIRNGISGTSMKAIPELKDEEVESLVDYVIYLTLRGELERNLLRQSTEISFDEGQHLFAGTDAAGSEQNTQQLKVFEDTLAEIADMWVSASEQVRDIPAPPEDVPVPETVQEVIAAAQSAEDTPLKRSIARGRELFTSEAGACFKCHGKEGYGDGQTQDYDEWTKEWTTRIGIDPKDANAQIPFIARGGLPARTALPRDFRLGLYRGGDKREQIYRRIAEGIDSTPMPAASLPPNDIWHLVNFVRSLAVPQVGEDGK